MLIAFHNICAAANGHQGYQDCSAPSSVDAHAGLLECSWGAQGMRDPQDTSLELRVRASCSMLRSAGAVLALAWRARGHSRISCVLPSFQILRRVAW